MKQKNTKFDVIAVGSATVDAFVNTGNKLFKKSFFRKCVVVPFGSKILIEDLKFGIGGGGTNTAVAFSRLGLKVSYLGSIGKGTNSQRVLELLKKERVDTSLIQIGDGRTGFSIVLDASGHERTILTFKGSNDDLSFDKIDKSKLNTKWFYFSAMLNKSFETQIKLAEFAKKNKIKIAYNPSSYLSKKGSRYLRPILEKIDFLVLNKEEAAYLAGNLPIKKMIKKLLGFGPELVAVTNGSEEAYASEGKYIYKVKPHHIKVVEATGAGDSFAASFVTGIITKGDIEFALKLAMANSESVITGFGPKDKLLTEKEILSKIDSIKITKEDL
jgi:ribokinase